MKVTILEPSGYCSGVERAMTLALDTKKNNPTKNVVILGMLVHNEDSLKTLEQNGIKSIYDKNCSLEQLASKIIEPSIVVLTAHGHKNIVEKILLGNGHEIVDATCPFVKNSFVEIVKSKNPVFYIGVNNHPEAIAALSISNNVHFIDYINPLIPQINCETPLVLSQTTLSRYEVKNIEDKITKLYPKANILNGICNASTKRQESLMNIKDDVDLIYIVGGSNSNNTKTLFNLAKNLYKDKLVKIIQNEKEINKKDLIGLSHVVISSGASTPKDVISKVKSFLLN